MSERPFITVTVPTYNRRDMLEKNVNGLLNQTLPPDHYEIIVVDDGSSDGTAEMMNSLVDKHPGRIIYHRQENQGPAAARSMGIELGKGEIIAYIDDDCIPKDNWVEEISRGYENPDVAGIAGFSKSVEHDSFVSRYLQDRRTYERAFTDQYGAISFPITLNASFRMSVLRIVNGFDRRFRYAAGEDVDLGLKIRSLGYCFGENVKAIVHHHHKTSFMQLITTWHKYGKGMAMYERLRTKRGYFSLIGEQLYQQFFIYRTYWKSDYQKTSSVISSILRFLLEKTRDTAFATGQIIGFIEYRRLKPETDFYLDPGF